jgi:hypothetical protein
MLKQQLGRKGMITGIINMNTNVYILNVEYVNWVMRTLDDGLTRMQHPDSSRPLKICRCFSAWIYTRQMIARLDRYD